MNEEEFINFEIIRYIHDELKNRGYEVELETRGTVWIYLEDVRVAFITYTTEEIDIGLYFYSGLLQYDHAEPKKVEISNPNFIDNIETMIKGKEKFLEADRNNRKFPNKPIVYRESDFKEREEQ